MKTLCFDTESDGLVMDSTRVWCMCVEDVMTGDRWKFKEKEMKRGLDLLKTADMLVGHNLIQHDMPILKMLYGFTHPKVFDTLVTSRVMWPCRKLSRIKDHSLGAYGKLLGFPKMEHDDFSQYSEEMLVYCENDVHLGVLVYKYQQLRWKRHLRAIKLEHAVAKIIADQKVNGFTVFPEKAAHLEGITSTERDRLTAELQSLLPPTYQQMKKPEYYRAGKYQAPSKGQLIAELRRRGIKVSSVTIEAGPPERREIPFKPGSGPDIVRAFKEKYNWVPKIFTVDKKTKKPTNTPATDGTVMEHLALRWPEAAMIVDYRLMKQRAEASRAWREHINPTTMRLHHSVNTNGAVTGRMTHSDPNVNVPKIKMDKDGHPILGYDGDFGYECRACFGPRPGWWQVGTDASGLELRMLAHFMGEYDGGEYAEILLKGDIHTHNMKAAGLSSRDQAKTFIYGFLYGAGGAKIGKIVNGTKADGEALKAKFLKGLPALGALKRWLDDQVQNKGYLVGLDERIVPIRSPHLALNTLLQGGGAIVMKYATVYRNMGIVRKHGPYGQTWGDMAMVHDEWQSEAAKRAMAEDIGKIGVAAIRKAGEHLELRCRLDGEYKVGKSWADCH